MRRLVLSCLLLAGFMLISLRAEARQRFTGICITGNETINANRRVHNASCTVRVFDSGTSDLSAIFSDNTGTILANPFTAGTDGFYFFYADDGRYDVQMSAGTPAISSAKTIGDVRLADAAFPAILLVVSFSATPAFDTSAADTFIMTLTGNVTSSTITNPAVGKIIRFILTQDATGGRTFAFPADVVLRTGAYVIADDANAVTAISFVYDGTNWQHINHAADEAGSDLVPAVDGADLGSTSSQWDVFANLTQGSVVFVGVSGLLSQDNPNIFWDDSLNRLGIGTASPTSLLHVAGDGLIKNAADSTLRFDLDSGLTTAQLISLGFRDQGTLRYEIRKTAANALIIQDTVSVVSRIQLNQAADNRYRCGSLTDQHEFMDSAGLVRVSVTCGVDGLTFGTLADTNLYRSTTDTLKTDDSFIVGGSVGIGIDTPATSAILDLTSTTGALLPTRMTTVQRDALTAVDGMVLYNSTDAQLQGRVSGAWVGLGAGVPSGLISWFNVAACPAGWTRVVAGLQGRFFRERAADTVGTTGGADTASPTTGGPSATNFVDSGIQDTAVAADFHTHTVSHDNRPAFINLTACSKD